MKFYAILIFAMLMPLGVLNAQKAKVVCDPYVQCVTETGFTVIWSTDVDAVAWVEIAPDDGTHFYNREREKFYDARGNGILPIGKIHKVQVDGLEPGKTYRYRIMNKGVKSYNGSGDVVYMRPTGSPVYRAEPYRITTLKDHYDVVRFDVFNDVHGQDSLLNIILSNARENKDFVFLNGDMTSNISSEDLILKMYLKTVANSLKGELPLFVSRGNHELRGKDAVKWFDYFSTPTGTPYYSFSIGEFFFIVLDACEDKPDSDIEYSGIVASVPYLKRQERWLQETLRSEECKNASVRIAFCHVPPETKGWYGAAQLGERLVPHLNDADIDVMICGHLHQWRVDCPGDGMSEASFPVICNDNLQRMEVTATSDKIEIVTYDVANQKTHDYTVDLQRNF